MAKTILLTTSTANDVVFSNGTYSVAGLKFKKSNITSAKHIRFKAEVPQVVTIDTTAATSPLTSTDVTVKVNVKDNTGRVTESKVTLRTPATITELGGSAAVQNEAVNAALVAKLNALGLPFTAASLTSGEGITITDKAGYFKGNRGGATGVTVTGFTATTVSATTKAVYSFGVGADLAANQTISFPYGSATMDSGNTHYGIPAPKTVAGASAVSGQKYDAFVFSFFQESELPVGDGKKALQEEQIFVFVDNGTGSVTTNAAGFLAFEKAMHKIIALYNKSVHSVEEFFDGGFIGAAVGGGAVGGTETTSINTYVTPYGTLAQHIMGDTATVIYPVQGNTGWVIDNDNTATEGCEWTPPIATVNDQKFTVGKSAFQNYMKVLVGDATDVNLRVGFRKVQADQADFGYSDYAVVSLTADVVKTAANLNGGTPYTKTTTDVFADATYYDVQVIVNIDGTVVAKVNGKEYAVESASGVAMVFDAGDTLIPTSSAVNVGGGDADTVFNQLIVNENVNWLD